MEVLVGFGVTSSAEASEAYIREAAAVEAQDNGQGVSGTPLSRRMIFPKRNGYEEAEEEEEDDEVVESDRSSSSIGLPDDSDDEEDEASSKDARKGFESLGSLGSLASLEDTLPVKRGLSNHFSGKSKSFTNLDEAIATTSAKDLEKTEHPFNKKRRILRWSKNMMLPTAMSMPLLPVAEEDDSRRDLDGEEDDRDRVEGEKKLPTPRSVFKSYSCFALTDLREEEEEEDD